ncbi:MAG TPA: HAMP domain-containing protein, partial [Desulfomonilia bacterium]|nr:HAMP domain-containing protein [Desulfomonilia bacterium]
MSLRKILSLRQTLSFRLAVYYTAIFTLSSFIAFLVFYLIISSELQHNRDQQLLENLNEYASVLKLKGLDELKNEISIDSEAHGVADMFIRLFDSEDRMFFSSNMTTWRHVRISYGALFHLRSGAQHYFVTLEKPGHRHKARSVYGVVGPGIVMQVGETIEEDEEFLRIFRTVFGIVMALLVPCATAAGWIMGSHALQGVEEVTQTALSISKGDLDQRVSVSTDAEEITRLAGAFNFMLDRINALVEGIRNILDDIAHDLKRPIARIRVIAEKNLYTGSGNENGNAYPARILEECDNLMQMI